jgi:hypothetical protein
MRKIILIFLVALKSVAISGGKSNFNFLTIGIDAKAVSMGDAVVSSPISFGFIYYNPAILSMIESPSVMVSYRNWMVDGDILYSAIGIKNKFVNMALSLHTLIISNIELREKPGDPIGYFSARNVAVSFSISPNFKSKFKIGLTTKYILEKIFVYETNTLSADLGFLYILNFRELELNFGGAIRNIAIPSSIMSLGASVKYATDSARFLLTSELRYRNLEKRYSLGVGSSFEFNSILNFQAGYEFGFYVHSFKFGLGVKVSKFSFNYAYSPFDYSLPSSHTLSLIYKL